MDNYYTAPSDEVFNEIKDCAVRIWNTYDDTYGYRTEKLNRITDIENIKDNAWFIIAMFDSYNREILLGLLKPETRHLVLSVIGVEAYFQ